jgi:hypothetical protein
VLPQEETIRSCLEAGLIFHYGLIFDLVDQTIDDLLAEIEFIVANPRITLPSFLSFTIPMLGTPLFGSRLREGLLLPNVKLRDMDGRSLVCHPVDPIEKAIAFAARMDQGPDFQTQAGSARLAVLSPLSRDAIQVGAVERPGKRLDDELPAFRQQWPRRHSTRPGRLPQLPCQFRTARLAVPSPHQDSRTLPRAFRAAIRY